MRRPSMPFYALMDGTYGDDGLESDYPVFISENADDVFRKWLLMWDVILGNVNIVTSLDLNEAKKVHVMSSPSKNYPHWAEPEEFPDWFLRAMRDRGTMKKAQDEIRANYPELV
jgi:hypothetical protein